MPLSMAGKSQLGISIPDSVQVEVKVTMSPSNNNGSPRSESDHPADKSRHVFEALSELQSDASDTILASLKTATWSDLHETGCFDEFAASYNVPRIIAAKRCWVEEQPPSDAEIMTAVLEACRERDVEFKKQIVRRGKPRADDIYPYQSKLYQGHVYTHTQFFGHFFSQLQSQSPDPRTEILPLKMTDVELEGTEYSRRYRIPEKALGITESSAVKLLFQSNIGLKGADIAPHMDHGASVVSLVFGSCKKLWCVWPPTEENLEIHAEMRSSSAEVMAQWGQLQHGAMGILDSTKAIYLPPGWIHATLAITPGLLCGRAFIEPSAAPMAARSLLKDIAVDKATGRPNADRLSEALISLDTFYKWTLVAGLLSRDADIKDAAMDSWMEVQAEFASAVEDGAFEHATVRQSCMNIHAELRKRVGSSVIKKDTGRRQCPAHADTALTLKHFMDEHVAFLPPLPKKRKRGSGDSNDDGAPEPNDGNNDVEEETAETDSGPPAKQRKKSSGKRKANARVAPQRKQNSSSLQDGGARTLRSRPPAKKGGTEGKAKVRR